MSQISNKLAKAIKSNFHRKFCHEPGESVSSRSSRGVGDSARTIEGQRITNIATGTFTEFSRQASEKTFFEGVRRLRPRYEAREPRNDGRERRRPEKNRFSLAVATLMLLMVPVAVGINNTHDTYATASTIGIGITGSPTLNLKTTTDGVFGDSGNATVTVTTNHAAGYALTLSASGKNNPTSLDTSGGTSSTATVGFTSLATGTLIDASTFDSATYNGKWGYRYNKDGTTTANDDKYRPSPSTTGDTLDTTSNSDNGTYKLSIGARADTNTAIAEYSNTFVFAVTGNPTPYAITYNANTTDTVTNMPTNHTTSDTGASGETVTLASNTPSRTDYEFQGWCTVAVADGASCTGTSYPASGTWDLNQTSSTNSLTLYAMWKVSDYTITFKANGGTGSDYAQTIIGTDYLSDNSFTRSNYYFKGWGTSTSTVTYRPGQSITPTDNMTLYAIWAPSTSSNLYDIVSSLSKGTQTAADLRTAITKDNSGVYTYNSSVFGTTSDASTSNNIYYYRGILDSNLGTYGSNGDGGNYPNFVILQAGSSKATTDTCWRIVRTTGSGGVKMIYNGKWTGSTCANAAANAQATTSAFNSDPSDGKGIVGVGYTFNANYKTTTASTAYSTLFGSNTSFSGNSTSSTIKTYIENTWFTNINSWASKLEASAGYCNDRTLNTGTSWTTPATDSTSISTPYATATYGITAYYFGSYIRTRTTTLSPSLTCPRSGADLYTTSSASNGNKRLSKPAALLTADESAFAGSGHSSSTTPYHANSFLNSGSRFWLLSPGYRYAAGEAGEFFLYSNGALSNVYVGAVKDSSGVRPAISLTSGTTTASGSGTATDPWVVKP